MEEQFRFTSQLETQTSAVNVSQTADLGSQSGHLFLEVTIGLMCIAAATGNLLVIVIVAATKSLHSVSMVLTTNLAVSDLCVGLGIMPVIIRSFTDHGWMNRADLCAFVGFLSSVCCTASVLTLAAIALDRYLSIVDCLRYSSRCTPWRACAAVLWIWLQALVTSSPPLLGWSSVSYIVPMYICAVDWTSSPSYTAVIAVLSYLLPAFVILFCYTNIVLVARRHARRIQAQEQTVRRNRSLSHGYNSSQHLSGHLHCSWRPFCDMNLKCVNHSKAGCRHCHQKSNACPVQHRAISSRCSSPTPSHAAVPSSPHHHHHGFLRVILVVSAFLLCWTPSVVVAIVQAAEMALKGQSTVVPGAAVTMSFWLMLLSSNINPLLYALLSKRFQSGLHGLGQKLRRGLRSLLGINREVSSDREAVRGNNPSIWSTAYPSPHSSAESLSYGSSRLSSSLFTVWTGVDTPTDTHIRCMCSGENTCVFNSSGAFWRGGLRVLSRPQEGSRLPSPGLTEEQQGTFLCGQVIVRVECDVHELE